MFFQRIVSNQIRVFFWFFIFLIKEVSIYLHTLFPSFVLALNLYFFPFFTFFMRLPTESISLSEFGSKEITSSSLNLSLRKSKLIFDFITFLTIKGFFSLWKNSLISCIECDLLNIVISLQLVCFLLYHILATTNWRLKPLTSIFTFNYVYFYSVRSF